MKILVFDLANENVILSQLRKKFPSIGFKKQTINEDIEEEGRDIILIDTVTGLDHVVLIDDLNAISPGKALQGSELIMTLRILQKIGALDSVKLIGVPPDYDSTESFKEISSIIRTLCV